MGRALKYAGKYRKYINWATFVIFLGVVCEVIPYYIVNLLLVDIVVGVSTSIEYVVGLCLGVGLSLVARSLLLTFGLKLSHIGAFGTLYNMRVRFAKDMTNHSFGEIASVGTGKYKKAFVEDINNVERLVAHFIPEGLPNLFLIILVLGAIFITDWRMGLLSLASLPIGLIPTIVMFKQGVVMMPEYYDVKAKLNDTIIEYILGMEVVKVFGTTQKAYKRFTDAVDRNRDKTLGWWKSSWVIQSIVGSGLPCTILCTLPVGLYWYLNGSLGIDVFLFTIMLNLSIGSPFIKFINFLPFIPNVAFAVENLEEIFVKESVSCGLRTDLPDDYTIRYEDITFAYDDVDIIKGLSLELKPNTLTAFVGESGSGKSTLAKLLMHFWDTKTGGITLGGVDIREYTSETYMSQVSYVSQDTHLFSGSIFENIAMGKKGATMDEVIRVAKLSACHDFIMKLEYGYDTQIGDLGGKLSGGERQRLTIARAILKDAPIIILDEATAFADAENEALIQEALSVLLKGKTAIVIAHRLNTIVGADNIVVLEDGIVNTQGTHQELLDSSLVYQRLWERSEQAVDWNLVV